MKTERIHSDMTRAAELLRQGGLVAVPTETVYGLAGNGLDPAAVESIYAVKGRPAVKPLSLMVPDAAALTRCCAPVPEAAEVLAAAYWPGPLTIVLRAKPEIPELVRAGGATVGLRCPAHPLTLALLREAGVPLAAPSANRSGEPSPKTADDVLRTFDGVIAAVIDGGPCAIGRESTIVDLSRTPYRILREGAVPENEVWDTLVRHMTIVGITGGTGCGKTTALGVLQDRGACVLDCDAIYHELLETSRPLLDALEAQFPGTVEDGVLRRKKLGALVFADAEKLRLLNSVTHAHIRAEVQRRLQSCARNGGTLAAIDAIALIESGLAALCTTVLGVTAPREMRIERLMAREGIPRDYAEARMDAQKPDAWFESHCDRVLRNSGTLEEFQKLCTNVIQEVLS